MVLPEACVVDVTRCRVVPQSGQQIKDFVSRLVSGVSLPEGGLTPVLPSERQAAEEAEAAGAKATEAKAAEPAPVIVTELKQMEL